MKRWILGIGIGLGMALSATASMAQQCRFTGSGCNELCIIVNPGIGWVLNTDERPDCTHGGVDVLTPNEARIGRIGFYGPDCRLSFVNQTTGMQTIVEIQQDYCALEAGNITVTHIEGPAPQYTVEEGSWSDGEGGLVTITGFQVNYTPRRR